MNLRDIRNLEKDDLLAALGLQTRRTAGDWVLPTIGLFGLGLIVGAGAAMLWAPRGQEMTAQLRNRLQGRSQQAAASTGNGYGIGATTTPPV